MPVKMTSYTFKLRMQYSNWYGAVQHLELEETKSGRPKSFSVEAALKAYVERNERIIDQDINDWYRDWAWEHLGIEWNQSE